VLVLLKKEDLVYYYNQDISLFYNIVIDVGGIEYSGILKSVTYLSLYINLYYYVIYDISGI